eukprot:272200_1
MVPKVQCNKFLSTSYVGLRLFSDPIDSIPRYIPAKRGFDNGECFCFVFTFTYYYSINLISTILYNHTINQSINQSTKTIDQSIDLISSHFLFVSSWMNSA